MFFCYNYFGRRENLFLLFLIKTHVRVGNFSSNDLWQFLTLWYRFPQMNSINRTWTQKNPVSTKLDRCLEINGYESARTKSIKNIKKTKSYSWLRAENLPSPQLLTCRSVKHHFGKPKNSLRDNCRSVVVLILIGTDTNRKLFGRFTNITTEGSTRSVSTLTRFL